MPADNGGWLHDGQRLTLARPYPCQCGPQKSVGNPQPETTTAEALRQDGELVAKSKILSLKGSTRAKYLPKAP